MDEEFKPYVVTPDQYAGGYLTPLFPPPGSRAPIKRIRQPYHLIKRLEDGNYLVENPEKTSRDRLLPEDRHGS